MRTAWSGLPIEGWDAHRDMFDSHLTSSQCGDLLLLELPSISRHPPMRTCGKKARNLQSATSTLAAGRYAGLACC